MSKAFFVISMFSKDYSLKSKGSHCKMNKYLWMVDGQTRSLSIRHPILVSFHHLLWIFSMVGTRGEDGEAQLLGMGSLRGIL
jgi:hypothetical protein